MKPTTISIGTVSVALAILILMGCDKFSVPSSQKAVLMVTWLIPGQPPQSTQTEMVDLATCELAKQNAIAAGISARAERTRMNEHDKAEAQASLRAEIAKGHVLAGLGPETERKLRGEPLPQVSAYCIQQ